MIKLAFKFGIACLAASAILKKTRNGGIEPNHIGKWESEEEEEGKVQIHEQYRHTDSTENAEIHWEYDG